jgi:hypothetical protein
VIPPRFTGTEESKEEPDEDNKAVAVIYSAVTSDPGAPQTFEGTFF